MERLWYCVTVLPCFVFSALAQVKTGHYVNGRPVDHDLTDLLIEVAKSQNFSKINVVVDGYVEEYVGRLMLVFGRENIVAQLYLTDVMNATTLGQLQHSAIHNYLFVGATQNAMQLLKSLKTNADDFGRENDKWVVVNTAAGSRSLGYAVLTLGWELSNIIIIESAAPAAKHGYQLYMPRLRRFELIGTWDKTSGLQLKRSQLFRYHRPNLKGKHLKAVSKDWGFFQSKVVVNGTAHWSGLSIKIADALSEDLNFSYSIVESADNKWGRQGEDGQFDGVVGMLQRKEVDFGACALIFNHERFAVADTTVPFSHDVITVVLDQPTQTKVAKASFFIQPFSTQVWLCILATLLVYSIIFWIVIHYSTTLHGFPRSSQKQSLDQYSNSLTFLYGALLCQGAVSLPRTPPGKVLSGFYWFFVLILVTLHSGKLVSIKAVTALGLPFQTLEEMVRQTQYRWGCDVTGIVPAIFQNSSVQLYQKIGKNLEGDLNHAEGYKRMKADKYAFFTFDTWFTAQKLKDCKLVKLPIRIVPVTYAIALTKHSPYTQHFSHRVERLVESGVVDKWLREWINMQTLKRDPRDCGTLGPVANAAAIRLEDFVGCVILLGCGLLVALVVLLAENAWHVWHQTVIRPRTRGPGLHHRQQLGAGRTNEYVDNAYWHMWNRTLVKSQKERVSSLHGEELAHKINERGGGCHEPVKIGEAGPSGCMPEIQVHEVDVELKERRGGDEMETVF